MRALSPDWRGGELPWGSSSPVPPGDSPSSVLVRDVTGAGCGAEGTGSGMLGSPAARRRRRAPSPAPTGTVGPCRARARAGRSRRDRPARRARGASRAGSARRGSRDSTAPSTSPSNGSLPVTARKRMTPSDQAGRCARRGSCRRAPARARLRRRAQELAGPRRLVGEELAGELPGDAEVEDLDDLLVLVDAREEQVAGLEIGVDETGLDARRSALPVWIADARRLDEGDAADPPGRRLRIPAPEQLGGGGGGGGAMTRYGTVPQILVVLHASPRAGCRGSARSAPRGRSVRGTPARPRAPDP